MPPYGHSYANHSPSAIIDGFAAIAPAFMRGPPPPAVMQALEDLERPLRGETFVQIKQSKPLLTVLLALLDSAGPNGVFRTGRLLLLSPIVSFSRLRQRLHLPLVPFTPAVLNSEANRIKMILNRQRLDAQNLSQLLMSFAFAVFTFLGNFAYDITGLGVWAEANQM